MGGEEGAVEGVMRVEVKVCHEEGETGTRGHEEEEEGEKGEKKRGGVL